MKKKAAKNPSSELFKASQAQAAKRETYDYKVVEQEDSILNLTKSRVKKGRKPA